VIAHGIIPSLPQKTGADISAVKIVTGAEKRTRVQTLEGTEKSPASIKYETLEEMMSDCSNPSNNVCNLEF
jgi:hypothetical protein